MRSVAGLCPDPLGSLQRSPDPLAGLKWKGRKKGQGSEKREGGQRQIYGGRRWNNRFPEKCGETVGNF